MLITLRPAVTAELYTANDCVGGKLTLIEPWGELCSSTVPFDFMRSAYPGTPTGIGLVK